MKSHSKETRLLQKPKLSPSNCSDLRLTELLGSGRQRGARGHQRLTEHLNACESSLQNYGDGFGWL